MLHHKISLLNGSKIKARNGMPSNARVDLIVAACLNLKYLDWFYPIACIQGNWTTFLQSSPFRLLMNLKSDGTATLVLKKWPVASHSTNPFQASYS